ncbi:ribonuclease M5 [Alkalibacter sp. M17DMB]|nr:ribonuclease M5 [Alkalibacter mobilis]
MKELIVVEGKDDISAVKNAVEAQVIQTSGLGLEEKTFNIIEKAVNTTGVIILTDPDYAGEKIRRMINERVPGCKNAFIPKKEGTKNGNVGVENASPQAIREAIDNVKVTATAAKAEHTMESIMHLGLLFGEGSKERRQIVGDRLGIGPVNGKQFLNRINSFGISLRELEDAMEDLKKES